MTNFASHITAIEYRPLLAVLIPLVSSVIILAVGDLIRLYARSVLSVIVSVLEIAVVFSMLTAVRGGGAALPESYVSLSGLPVSFSADSAGIVTSFAASVLWMIISLYLTGYMRARKDEDKAVYQASHAMCIAAFQGMCFAADLVTLVIFFAVMIAASSPLILIRMNKSLVNISLYICSLAGGIIAFVSALIIHTGSETTEFAAGGLPGTDMISGVAPAILFMMMSAAGLVTAAAAAAPSAARALMYLQTTGAAGAFFILRTVIYVFGPDTSRAVSGNDILAWIAVIAAAASFAAALYSKSVSKRLSFVSAALFGAAVLGICIFSPFSLAGAIYHLSAQAFVITLLFMSWGAVYASSGSDDMNDISAAGRGVPAAAGAFGVAIAAAAGFPPFAGFPGMANILYGAIFTGRVFFAAALVLTGIMAIICLMPVIIRACSGEKADSLDHADPASMVLMTAALALCVLVIIFLGLMPDAGLHLFELVLNAGNAAFTPLM